jgi:hypothetical protein
VQNKQAAAISQPFLLSAFAVSLIRLEKPIELIKKEDVRRGKEFAEKKKELFAHLSCCPLHILRGKMVYIDWIQFLRQQKMYISVKKADFTDGLRSLQPHTHFTWTRRELAPALEFFSSAFTFFFLANIQSFIYAQNF